VPHEEVEEYRDIVYLSSQIFVWFFMVRFKMYIGIIYHFFLLNTLVCLIMHHFVKPCCIRTHINKVVLVCRKVVCFEKMPKTVPNSSTFPINL